MGHLSLKKSIYVGFAIIVGVLVVNGLISYLGLLRLQEAAAQKQQIEEVRGTVIEIDRDVQALRLRVDRYVASGHPSLRDEAQSLNRRLQLRIRSAQGDAEINELFRRAGFHIEDYEKQFAAVVVERGVREDLVEVQLPKLATAVQASLGELSAAFEASEMTDQDRLTLTQCQSFFSKAEKSFLRYFAMPSTVYVNDAVEATAAAVESLQTLSAKEPYAAVVAAIGDYERTGLRAVQATRSYLFLRNVVMAGDASEVAYYASSLRELADKRSEAIARGSLETSTRVKRVTAAAIVVAVLLAGLIAWRLAFLIIPPLSELTVAFQELSAGKTIQDIPGVDRSDEIGAMAQAARVFSDRNQQTRELLDQSEGMRVELQKQAEELAASNRELDNFAYVASHDLKSPLRGIRQLASWIEEDAADRLTGDSKEHLQHMQSRVGKMESLLAGLLEYSRVGKLKTKSESVNVQEVLAGIEEITDNPEGVAVRYPEKLPTFSTLRTPFEQVLMNLIGNAIKYNHRGDEGLVDVGWETCGDHYRVIIQDNGPGIHAKDHERVFQMYQRVGDSDIDGSGMGLALVKKQVERMGGQIRVESSLGDGARFEFTWPVEPPQENEQPA